jgi:hypothetical protein
MNELFQAWLLSHYERALLGAPAGIATAKWRSRAHQGPSPFL